MKSLSKELRDEFGDWNDSSYEKAWARLVKVHNNPYVICRDHIRAMEQLPVLTGPATSDQLQRMANVAHEQIRQLRAWEIPVEHWDMWIVHLLHDRLQNETGRQWDLTRTSPRPSAEEMLDFLDKQAAALANMSQGQREQLQVTIPNERANRNKSKDRGPSASRTPTPSGGAGKKRFPCEACGKDHPLFACDDFNGLSFNAKKNFVECRSLCPNCFKRGHPKEKCFQVKCSFDSCKADPFHNSLLCPFKQNIKRVHAAAQVDESGSDGAWSLPSTSGKKDKKKSNKPSKQA